MAQTGYSKVQIYSSSTATHTPSAGNLTNDTNGSELAINITDGKLFYKDNSGTVQVLATKGSGVVGGSNTQVQYNSSGTFAGSGNLVFDGTNLGVGVTPSAWTSSKAIQIGSSGAPYMGLAQMTTGTSDGYMLWGAYLTGNRTFAYSTTGDPVSAYRQSANTHAWFNAPSGTAGNAITFTQAMLLDASSNLTIAGSTATKASGTTWANPSDTRLKNNQALYTKGLTELNQIKVKTWVYNGLGGSLNGQTGIGVIADEAMIVLPDTVDTYSAKLNPTDSEETDIKRFNASEVIWLLVTSLQELDAKFESYKATHP